MNCGAGNGGCVYFLYVFLKLNEYVEHVLLNALKCTAYITSKTPSISRTKSQNLNASCILLQLSSSNPLKPGVKLRMKM